MGPLDFFRSRLDNIRAHPFQSIGSAIAGGLVPGGGILAQQAFNRYNDNRFNNAATTSYDRGADQGNQAAQAALDKPLNGPNALVSGLPGALGGPTFDNQDRQMANALTGNGGGQSYGGPMGNPQDWSYGQFSTQLGGPAQSSGSGLVDALLGPYGTGTPGQHFMNHQGIKDKLDAEQNQRLGNYGVSNFMVGGSPVIFGSRGNDMNQAAMMRRTPGY